MANVTITKVLDMGNDLIEVYGYVGEAQRNEAGVLTNEVKVEGWMSALTNHYGPESYDADGHLLEAAQSRAMTDSEQGLYFASLISALYPEPKVLFEAKGE